MKKIKSYFNTFQWEGFQGKGRIIGFNILSLVYAVFILYYFATLFVLNPDKYPIFRSLLFDISMALIGGYLISLIMDLTVGIGREGPLFYVSEDKKHAKGVLNKHCRACSFMSLTTGKRVYFMRTWLRIREVSEKKYLKFKY